MSAWTVIDHEEVPSGGAASIEFTNIPNTYTDLVLKMSVRVNTAQVGQAILISLNGSTADFTNRFMQGNGSSPSTGTFARYIATAPATSSTADTFGNASVYIPNYAGNTNKSMSTDSVSENNATNAFAAIQANLWSQTAAITSLKIEPENGNSFLQYSSATLYGITKGSSGGVTVS